MNNWFQQMFIDEAKPAMERHSGTGYVDPEDPTIVLVDDAGNQVTAVLVDEETVFDATANDIREGKVAATEAGVTVGTKEIPSYVTTEGYVVIPNGSEFSIPLGSMYDFTKLQAIVCPWVGSIAGSVAAEQVVIGENVYPVNSAESITVVMRNSEKQAVDLGISNNSGSLYLIRYFTYKEVV